MNRRAFPIIWTTEGDGEVAVGEASLTGDRVVLAGKAKGNAFAFCDFAPSDVDTVVISRHVNPMLHVRLRDRGWLRITAFSTVLIVEFAQAISQQLP